MNENLRLAELLFPQIQKKPEDYEKEYPPRPLKEGAKVMRFSPSPTGFMHIGNLFVALIDRMATEKDGIFYLRIEDTDKKREVEGAIDAILAGLSSFGILPDEGKFGQNEEKGDYGPYQQSRRAEIYACYAKYLVEKGLAYPCFCTEEELGALREAQEKEGVTPGYYGKWAKCRNLSLEEIQKKLDAKQPYVLRLRSPGDENRKVYVNDLVRGKLEMAENIMDLVLLKTNGIPTYHFAHAVDDHLMRTTHVVRGDEWIASLPIHLQLFQVLNIKPPKYAHIAPIMKLENGNKRKISKRKDPEASVGFYAEQGYPADSVKEYLMTIANSDFEDWRRANKEAPLSSFPFQLKKLSPSGALFDMAKLNDISKNIIAKMTTDQVFEAVMNWAKRYDPDLTALLERNPEYARAIFSIDRGGAKPRKDLAAWNEVRHFIAYFYDELFVREDEMPEQLAKEDIQAILLQYKKVYRPDADKDQWFADIKAMCEPLGFSPDTKAYKKSPESFKGHIGDLTTVIRIAVTGRRNTPDLYWILRLLGQERIEKRLEEAANR